MERSERKRRGERGWQDGRRGACVRPAGLRAAGCWLQAAGCRLLADAAGWRGARRCRVSCAVCSVECGPHQYFSSPNARAPKPGGRPLVRVRVTNPNQCSRVGGRRSAVSHRGTPGPPRPGGRVPIIATRRRPGPQAPAGCLKDRKVEPLSRERLKLQVLLTPRLPQARLCSVPPRRSSHDGLSSTRDGHGGRAAKR